MAATLVGGAFLSATVQTLVEKLASSEFRDYLKNTNLNISLLKQLRTTLLTLRVVLDDAEEKQIKNQDVKQWLDELKDAVFDAQDLLEEIAYDSLRCKVEKTHTGSKTSQVLNFFTYPFNSFYAKINSQMKVLCERMEDFAKHKDILDLKTVSGRVSHRTPSSSVVNESVMVGRADDKERLVNMLLSQRDTSSNDIGVVAIWGMGGVGKTTLAQLLYNQKEVQEHFDLKAWACVSEEFDILRVTKALLESITSKTWDTNNLDTLRVELKKNSREKKFLFVLDDLWNDNHNDWDELVSPFINGKSGSRVILTTRNLKVAEVAHTFPIHNLKPLSDKDCWSILSKHVLGSVYFHDSRNTNLEKIGRDIAKKCGGLPIAAKTLGGLLRSKVDTKEWTSILNSDIWNFPNDNVLPALRLSYQYLPSHLKRCFAYCSIFPKDYIFDRKQVVLLWMAEGFLEHSEGEKEVEEVGDDFFDELLSRSLIQKSIDDARGEKFVMHDLVNDLATTISGKSCVRLECVGNVSENVRYLSYNQEFYDIFKKFEICYKFKCLRSFLPLSPYTSYHGNLSRKVVNDLLPTLIRLRVLSLSKYANITMLPDSIESLVHLRYLDASGTEIKSLPDAICNLYNLQTLILSNCQTLTELPKNIGKLISLRHLDISETNIEELPLQIVELENLRTLTLFVVGQKQVGLSIKELRKFTHLQGKFTISNLHNITDVMEAFDANLKSKEQIEELALRWSTETKDSQLEGAAVLDALQPSINLKKLSLYSYGGTSFPSWLGNSSFSNMVSLKIHNCEYCVTLPPLGKLCSLKLLHIDDMPLLETIGLEFYGMEEGGSDSSFQPFPSLQNLTFREMPKWKEWLPFVGNQFPFPKLITLSLFNCPELRGNLPSHLSSIEKLSIECCDHLLAIPPPTFHWLSSIKEIGIEGGKGFEETSGRNQLSLLESDSPCLLQRVTISRFRTLSSMPTMIQSSTCLQHLKLSAIPSLTAFPNFGLPTSLCSLVIDRCVNLSFLPPETWRNYKSLVTLELKNSCNALTSFALDGFPVLKGLTIYGCDGLESIYISESCSSLCPSTLRSLNVYSCKALRSLPQQMDTFTALESIDLFDCPSLRSLPQRMDTLTALDGLTLLDLPKLELSFSEGTFLPSKLRRFSIHLVGRATTTVTEWGLQRLTALSRLSIGGDDNVIAINFVGGIMTPVTEWGLQHLTSLSYLSIGCGDDIVETLLKERLLPISLVSLTIANLSEMKSIEGSGLRHLTSLEEVSFYDCKVLEPFLEDTLPSSLKVLLIRSCPVLEAAYESERGEHWSNIAHIPVKNINGKLTMI